MVPRVLARGAAGPGADAHPSHGPPTRPARHAPAHRRLEPSSPRPRETARKPEIEHRSRGPSRVTVVGPVRFRQIPHTGRPSPAHNTSGHHAGLPDGPPAKPNHVRFPENQASLPTGPKPNQPNSPEIRPAANRPKQTCSPRYKAINRSLGGADQTSEVGVGHTGKSFCPARARPGAARIFKETQGKTQAPPLLSWPRGGPPSPPRRQ